ncbi:MAG: LarC family nickel insertion protein [Lentisphaerae bacterium]|nr:LarC family nickel insertion protein [Lentisphaerota bacterium]
MNNRILHFESIGGASGDMILGALAGLGVSLEELNEELKSLQVDPFEIVVDDLRRTGAVRIKVGARGGKPVTASPEIEDCRKCAAESGTSVKNVYDAALSAYHADLK